MEFTLEGFVIAVFGILPGFWVSLIRNVLNPEAERAGIGEWVAKSIIVSLVLHLLVAAIFLAIFSVSVGFNSNIVQFTGELRDQPVTIFLWYGVSVYVAASAAGIASSLLAWRPAALAHQWRLTPISPMPNVFSDELSNRFRTKENLRLHGQPEQQVPWIRLERAEITIMGRLRRSNVQFDIEKPFEVFLSPAYLIKEGSCPILDPLDGIHLRVLPTDIVEIRSERADWMPTVDV
jgi:hypothetical protein